MSAAAQWAMVAVAVVAAAVYALQVLLPRAWRTRIARALRARGARAFANFVDGGRGRCDACPAAACPRP